MFGVYFGIWVKRRYCEQKSLSLWQTLACSFDQIGSTVAWDFTVISHIKFWALHISVSTMGCFSMFVFLLQSDTWYILEARS